MKTDLLIGNEWRAAGKRYCLTNPATEEPLAEVAEAGEAEIDAAVQAARACLDSKEWRDLPARKRGALLFRLAERAKKLTPGDPFDKNTRLGAIVSKRQQDTVLSYIAAGKEEGARLVAGGNPAKVNGKGFYVEATVFDGAKPGMKIVDEEIFGPVLSVLTFENEDEGVRLANRSMYGLAAGIWTKDIQRAHRVARAIKAGTVWVNTYNFYDPAAPFGGYKFSGFGRDLGKEALDNYTETKTVWIGL